MQASLDPAGDLGVVPALGSELSERPVGLDRVGIQIERTPVAGGGRLEALEEAQDVSVPHVKAGIVGILREASLVVAERFLRAHLATVLKPRGHEGHRRSGGHVPGQEESQQPDALDENVSVRLGRERVVVPSATPSALDPVRDDRIGVDLLRVHIDGLDVIPIRAPASPALEGETERRPARIATVSAAEECREALHRRSPRRGSAGCGGVARASIRSGGTRGVIALVLRPARQVRGTIGDRDIAPGRGDHRRSLMAESNKMLWSAQPVGPGVVVERSARREPAGDRARHRAVCWASLTPCLTRRAPPMR